MIWYSLLIPLIISGVGYFAFKKQITPLELFIPTIISFIIVLISYFAMKSSTLQDVEYNGYVIVEARYYEAWSTWVDRTCSYESCTGTGNNRTCTTIYYDCSYCDENSAYWEVVDSGGNHIGITEEKYNQLKKKWNATPQFVELDRSIDEHGSCGVDGDMYSIKWDNHIYTSETSTYEKSFTNILKCNHSAFNYPVITKEEAIKKGLYDYPTLNGIKQECILGLDSIDIRGKERYKIKLDYLNGKLGPKNKVRVFTLLFKGKPIDIAFLQEAYWDGGNQNELIVCIGVDKTGKLNWVKPFSWCDNKRIIVDTREDIMKSKQLDINNLYKTYDTNIQKFWHYKSFEDFNYLSFEPTKGQLIFVYITTLIVSLISFFWCVFNQEENEDEY